MTWSGRLSPVAWIGGSTLGLAALLTALASPVGLAVEAFPPGAPPGAAPVFRDIDVHPSTDSARALADRLGGRHRLRWTGFLRADRAGSHEVGAATADAITLWIDGRLVLRRDGQPNDAWVTETTDLAAGDHLVSIELDATHDRVFMRLGWREPGGAFAPLPAHRLSPARQTATRWAVRPAMPWLLAALVALWLALLTLVAIRVLSAIAGPGGLAPDRATAAVVSVLAVVFVMGIWWGVPGTGWALDELAASDVRLAWAARFSGGWHELYPPLHYAVLALASAPLLAAEGASALSPEPPLPMLYLLTFRAVSALMALGTVCLVGRLARLVLGPRYGWTAALAVGSLMPFAYYAKTANVDMPYVFWFALSLLLLARAYDAGRARDLAGAAATAALAVATKDQAYGLYALPAVHLAWHHVRHGRAPGALVAGVLAGVMVFAVAHNIPFNFTGFLAHVDALTGPASQDYRAYPPTAAGQAALGLLTLETVIWMLGWAGLAAVALPLLSRREAPRVPLWLWLVAVSYHVTFVAVVGYVYDRFLLPVAIVFALAVAAGIGHLLARSPRRSAWRLAAIALLSLLVWRAVSVDVLLVADGRYRVERWLADRVEPGDGVGVTQQLEFLPRLDRFGAVHVTAEDTAGPEAPRWLVVNVEEANRDGPDSPRRRWLAGLEADAGRYREVFRYKSPLTGTAFAWTTRFTDRLEDPITNLDKANPEIAVFERQD